MKFLNDLQLFSHSLNRKMMKIGFSNSIKKQLDIIMDELDK